MKRIIYIPFDHLNQNFGALKGADSKSDLIALVESSRMVSGESWHKVRLYFMISSARHFAKELQTQGFQVRYKKSPTTLDGLKEILKEFPGLPIICAEPSSHQQFKDLKEFGLEFIPNDFFLTPRPLFAEWAGSQKSYLMENFYRGQRLRLNILMDGKKPLGGQWNFDAENRKPLPKGYQFPEYLTHTPDSLDAEVAKELGIEIPSEWATTRKGALKQLKYFMKNHFGKFGPYEDAMTTENWALHHSLLSPYLNIGLLHPAEVVKAALAEFEKGNVSIESAEGFIRQVIGWREYVNGMYWHLGVKYKEENQLNLTRKLLPLFEDSKKTEMRCLKTVVSDIEQRSWTHHIPRLMILSNLAQLTGVNPQKFLNWMRESFIDASDWVMVPNVIGMGMHADGGLMMTKPYVSGGSYISKMSNFCKGCPYDSKKRVGADACAFTTLYWDFLDRNRETFQGNHRMARQLAAAKAMKDMPEIRERAKEVLKLLEQGKY